MQATDKQGRGRQAAGHWLVFVTLQLIILPTMALSIMFGGSGPRSGMLPPLANDPLVIEPEFDYPFVITDEQLIRVLDKLRPRLLGKEPKINHVDHALRFWGVDAVFNDPKCLSGERLRRILTDHRAFAAVWGETTRPLLINEQERIVWRIQEGSASSSHVDHTLATLAEVGTPLDYPLITANGKAQLRSVMHQALRQFSLNQQEYEWTTLAYALYAAKTVPWYSREGQQITYDRLAGRIMRQPHGQGCCYGNHRLYTLTILLRIDSDRPIFSSQIRDQVMSHLREATRRLIASQATDGSWDRSWSNEVPESDELSPLARRLLATGHALEWWAMAPRELHPTREVLVRGGQWLVEEIDKLSDAEVQENYTFLTHVGRALALWRGDFPAALQQRLDPLSSAGGTADPERKYKLKS